MSYAEAAASSGPIGAEKIPEPTTVESSPVSGNIKVVNEDKFEEIKKSAEAEAKKAEKFADDLLKKSKKDLDAFEKKAKEEYSDFVTFLSKKYQEASASASEFFSTVSEKTSKVVAQSSTELENPVVVIQAVAGIGGIVAGYIGYLERHRIRSDSNVVLGIHGAIITTLIGLDVYLFGKYYPKYDKKSKKL